MTASSADEIMNTYNHVQVLDRPPDWWTADDDQRTPRLKINEPDAALKVLEKVR